MSRGQGTLAARASEMRALFDATFGRPPLPAAAPPAVFLGILVGSAAYAIRLDEIGAVFKRSAVTPLPGQHGACLGLAGYRGKVLPVFSLAALLGEPAGGTPRWLVIAADAPVALGFNGIEGHLRAQPGQVGRETEPARGSREILSIEGRVRPIVQVASLIDKIRGKSEAGIRQEES